MAGVYDDRVRANPQAVRHARRARCRVAAWWEARPRLPARPAPRRAAPGRRGARELGGIARGFASALGEVDHLLTPLAPGVELVGLESVGPRGLGRQLVAHEPVGPAQFVIG